MVYYVYKERGTQPMKCSIIVTRKGNEVQAQEVLEVENAYQAFIQAQEMAQGFVNGSIEVGLQPSIQFLHNGYIVSTYSEESGYKGMVITLVNC